MCSRVGSVIEVTPVLQGYYAAPRLKSGRRMGIAVVHDVLGFADPNCRHLVDHWASRGFEALMPDCFEKEAEPPGLPDDDDEAFQKWLANISNEKFRENCLLKVLDCIPILKEQAGFPASQEANLDQLRVEYFAATQLQ
ncbi:unnamed protein product [Cladocopium goreaui]|uniref:Dienelactone hydrolase domain-containing protein n=1 Tax=Cladocopium goreaui TaxID=2562237 RepID=A0A9P1DV05_9DINO|nr:unnamed protein product [Cladocopium goreaui]